ncbi:MAG: hypothetical protein AAFW98_18170, partial [Pseudomonadota bacterium]
MSEPFDADALGALYQKARTLEDAGDLEGAASVFAACHLQGRQTFPDAVVARELLKLSQFRRGFAVAGRHAG